ncbi:hypothetical protein ABVT39_012285 [Epinephelus coioides]
MEVNSPQTSIMKMLLLVSAVALLIKLAAASPLHTTESEVIRETPNRMYDLAKKCSASLSREFFAEDVSHLAEGSNKCGDKFFCKVHHILHNYGQDFCNGRHTEEIVRTLKVYNNDRNVTCEKTPGRMTNRVGLSKLFEHLMYCVQHRNTNEGK